jgi:hypothetical protein
MIGGLQIQTHRQQGNLIRLLSFFNIWKTGQKEILVADGFKHGTELRSLSYNIRITVK